MDIVKLPGQISRGMHLLRGALHPDYADLLIPETYFTREGFEFQVYHPGGRALRTVVLVYGMTILGEEDGHITAFARACASAGLRVIVPVLPGLKRYVVDSEDVFRLKKILDTLLMDVDSKLGVVGLSTGGDYALLLASTPKYCEVFDPVILLSPIYNLREVFERVHALDAPNSQLKEDWDLYYWRQCILAYRNHLVLNISDESEQKLQQLLGDFELTPLSKKRHFFEQYIAPLNLLSRHDLLNEGTLLDQLSIGGRLHNTTSPIYIMHGSSDPVVSPDHSRRIYAELARRGLGFKQKLLVTPWFSHVELQTALNVKELLMILYILGKLFD